MEKWKDRREFIFSYLCLIGTPTMNLMIKSHHECERREHNFSCSFYYGDGWNFFFFSLCPASGGRPPEDKRHRAKERVITQKWTNSSHIEV